MSTNYSATNQSYKHLSEAERGEIKIFPNYLEKHLNSSCIIEWKGV